MPSMSRRLHFVTGSVIADARGPFLRSALINLGRDNGVRVGYAVINGDGLVGRTSMPAPRSPVCCC